MVLGSGAVFALALVVAAVVADDVGDAGDVGDFDISGKVIAEAIGAGAGVGTPGLNAPQMPGMPVGGQMQAAAIPGGAIPGGAIPGLVPFARPVPERFSGRVLQVAALGADTGWGQVHATIADDTTGLTRIVSLAPDWYLQYLGCQVAQNVQVSGTAFRFDTAGPDVPVYARTVKVNGRPCQLRSDEGFALWSSRLGRTQ